MWFQPLPFFHALLPFDSCVWFAPGWFSYLSYLAGWGCDGVVRVWQPSVHGWKPLVVVKTKLGYEGLVQIPVVAELRGQTAFKLCAFLQSSKGLHVGGGEFTEFHTPSKLGVLDESKV